jgi:cytochrome c
LLAPVMMLAGSVIGMAQTRAYNVGAAPTAEEMKNLGVIVGPEGKELPPGKGTAKEGAELFAKQCAACHGRNGEGGVANKLVTGGPGNPHRGLFKDSEKHPIAYWPYATTVWDYINRAMPANKGGTLSPDEVYGVTAFLLYKNGIVQETDVLDAKTLPKIQMPNRGNFVPAAPVWPPNPKKPSWY